MGVGPRLFDDSIFSSNADKKSEFQYVAILVSSLDLDNKDREAQLDGVRDWLKNQKPSPTLVRSIRRDGFAAALRPTTHERSA